MTLWKQLCIVICLLFTLMFSGTFVISVHTMNRFIINQLSSHAQDTASSLALTLSEPLAEKDFLTIEGTVNAIFDRGYYKQITVQDLDGNPIYDNIFSEEIENAPDWFVQLIEVEPPASEALLKSGWSNIGMIKVISHPGYAYFELWNICKQNFWLFFSFAFFSSLIAIVIVHYLLQPLRTVTSQAEAITNREFRVTDKLPWTTEFRTVVVAMNTMSTKLKRMFAEHTELSELMRERSYKDLVTGLGNRRYFDSQFQHMLSSTESGIGGVLVLIHISDLKDYRKEWGFQSEDDLLKHVTMILTQVKAKYKAPILCHFGGADFAMVVMNIQDIEAKKLCEGLVEQFKQLHLLEGVKSELASQVGASMFTHDSHMTDILSKADVSLSLSIDNGPNQWHLETSTQSAEVLSVKDWSEYLTTKLKESDIVMHYQPVFFYEQDGTILFHNEGLIRLHGENKELLFAGLFLPIVDTYDLSIHFDKLVIETVIERILDNSDGSQRYAVNLSEKTIQDPGFVLWLSQKCARAGLASNRLNFEFPEFIVRDNFEAIKSLIDCVNVYGIQVGLDHFGCGFSSFGYLDQLKIDYIKIDGSYINKIENNMDNQVIIRSFVEIAHGLDMVVIATCVETEPERETLMKLHVDGMQGYFIGQPA